tara:strand:+ start:6442 stop:7242 length:801 start_codon:yes stop_codon:yes gene_type:complete
MKNLENFKLGIVIPLKSRCVSLNWQIVCDTLERTVNSVRCQDTSSFEFVVVGHDMPDFFQKEKIEDNFVHFFEYPAPNKAEYSGYDLQLKYEFDRCSKIAKGMLHLSTTFNITHWFALDADDVLCSDFVKNIEDLVKDADCVILKTGYFYFENLGFFNETVEFDQYCGSSLVISDLQTNIPRKIDDKAYKQTVFGKYSHVHAEKELSAMGLRIAHPKSPIITYVRENTENISEFYTSGIIRKAKIYLKAYLRKKRLSPDARKRLNI